MSIVEIQIDGVREALMGLSLSGVATEYVAQFQRVPDFSNGKESLVETIISDRQRRALLFGSAAGGQ